jgi:threonine dehydratase
MRRLGHGARRSFASSPLVTWKAPIAETDYLQRILTSRVYDVAIETPLEPAKTMSAGLNNSIFLKREDLQPVFSFKIRGAYNKISHLTAEERAAGIVCCSGEKYSLFGTCLLACVYCVAGNHAQGVAFAAKMLKLNAKIVMPLVAPQIKVDAVRRFGGEFGEVILHGNTYDEAAAEATRLAVEEGRTMIAPFDDPLVIAGQGTIGVEIVKQMTGKPLTAIFCCVGGGGLLAGVAAFVKRVRPEVQVYGVEAVDAAGMTRSLEAGRRVPLDHVGLFADGAAVKLVSYEPMRVRGIRREKEV